MRNNRQKRALIITLIVGLVLTGRFSTGGFTRALADEVPVGAPTDVPVVTEVPVDTQAPQPETGDK